MPEDSRARFDSGAEAWSDYNQQPLGRIRHEVTWQNLVPYLPSAQDRDHLPRALDAGGGSGELALRLVDQGYRVWMLDDSPAMLDQARQAALCLAPEARTRLTLDSMAVEDAPRAYAPGFFDLITCHTLIEYLPDPAAALHALAGLLRDGGLMSVSFVNRHAEILRQVWSRVDPWGALQELEVGDGPGGFCATLFDLPGRAFGADEVAGWLVGGGLSVETVRGIRVFADFLPGDRLLEPGFFEALLRLEIAAATRDPYHKLARYLQVIAHKGPVPETSAHEAQRLGRSESDVR